MGCPFSCVVLSTAHASLPFVTGTTTEPACSERLGRIVRPGRNWEARPVPEVLRHIGESTEGLAPAATLFGSLPRNLATPARALVTIYFGVIFVILLPCMPRPAISPFCPKTKA